MSGSRDIIISLFGLVSLFLVFLYLHFHQCVLCSTANVEVIQNAKWEYVKFEIALMLQLYSNIIQSVYEV